MVPSSIIILVLVAIIYYIFAIWTFIDIIKNKGGVLWIILGLFMLIGLLSFLGIIGLIAMIIWWANKSNRLQRKQEQVELREAQLHIFKKAKKEVHLTGKMRKLK